MSCVFMRRCICSYERCRRTSLKTYGEVAIPVPARAHTSTETHTPLHLSKNRQEEDTPTRVPTEAAKDRARQRQTDSRASKHTDGQAGRQLAQTAATNHFNDMNRPVPF